MQFAERRRPHDLGVNIGEVALNFLEPRRSLRLNTPADPAAQVAFRRSSIGSEIAEDRTPVRDLVRIAKKHFFRTDRVPKRVLCSP